MQTGWALPGRLLVDACGPLRGLLWPGLSTTNHRTFLMRAIANFAYNAGLDIRETVAQHFDLFHDGRKPVALYLRIPFTRITAFIELATTPVGFGRERGVGQWEFFAGRLQGVLCIEPAAGH